MKIVELLVDSLEELTGVDAVALVETPAIEADFFAFNEVDIEDLIVQQIIKKELFVDRLPGESQDDYLGRCIPKLIGEGYDDDQAAAICYDSLSKREENGGEKQAFTGKDGKYKFAIDHEQQMVVGPLMIPDKLIFRIDENNEPFYVFFSSDTIKTVAEKLMKDKLLDSINLEHNPEDTVNGYMVSSWIVEDVMKDKQQVYGFNFPVGTWMGQYKIEDKAVWEMVKSGDIKGFSVEGFFSNRFVQATAQK